MAKPKTKRELELETENAALREHIARLEGEAAGLRAVAEVLRQLDAPAPAVVPPATFPVCMHDFPSHQVGPIACRSCGQIASPLEVTYQPQEMTAVVVMISDGFPALTRPLTDEERLRITGCAPSLPEVVTFQTSTLQGTTPRAWADLYARPGS